MKANVREYGEKLAIKLEEANKNKQEFIDLINSGSTPTDKDFQKYQDAIKDIDVLEDELEPIVELKVLEDARDVLEELTNGKTVSEERKSKTIKVLDMICNNDVPIPAGFTEEDINNIEETRLNLTSELGELRNDIQVFQKRNIDTTVIQKEIYAVTEKIAALNMYVSKKYDIQGDISKLSNKETLDIEKKGIYNKYNSVISKEENNINEYFEKLLNNDKVENIVDTAENIVNNEKTDEINDELINEIDSNLIKEADKEIIKNEYEDIDEDIDNAIDEIDELDDDIEIIELEDIDEKTTTKKKKLSKKNKIALAKITGTVILITAVIIAAKSCSKKINNNTEDNNNDINTEAYQDDTQEMNTTNDYIVDTEDTLDIETVNKLVTIGYSDKHAKDMVKNFNNKTINKILSNSYMEEIEKYSRVADFNLDYLDDYETAININNITPEDAVDYVNRAYLINATNFYEDASIEDITEIVMSIDKRDLFYDENAAKAQSFNKILNRVADNFILGTITDNDINKLEAIKHFAKEGSDMDKFLTEFAELDATVIKNPNDTEAKDKLYDLLNIYTTSLNGFKNDKSALTNDSEFNEKAQINDYNDFCMIYSSFIVPLYPTYNIYDGETNLIEDKVYSMDFENNIDDYYSKATDVIRAYNDSSNKFNSTVKGKFNDSEIRYLKYQTLQGTMISALQGPEFEMICGKSLSLGGEN